MEDKILIDIAAIRKAHAAGNLPVVEHHSCSTYCYDLVPVLDQGLGGFFKVPEKTRKIPQAFVMGKTVFYHPDLAEEVERIFKINER